MEAGGKKKVLFLGLTDYDLGKDDISLQKKFLGLSQGMDVYVLARGKGWGVEKYGVKFYLIPRRFGKFGIFIWMYRALTKGRKLVASEGINTVVAQSPTMEGFVGARIKQRTKIELIVESHGDWVNSPFIYHTVPFEYVARRIIVWFGKYSLKHADKVRVISKSTEALARKYIKNVTVYKFPAFIDAEIFNDTENISWEERVIYVGALYKIKGVDVLIQAFQKARQEFPNIMLDIVGDGPYRGHLEGIASAGSTGISFVGRKTLVEVKEAIARSTVLVLPSLSEGLGRVLIEAGLLGKPVIGSNVGGIPDVITNEDNGYLFAPNDVDDLSEKLKNIFSDIERAKAIGSRNRERSTGIASTEKYFAEYREMVNARNS